MLGYKSYNYINPDVKCLTDWATKRNLPVLCKPKHGPSLFSGRWNTGANLHRVFASEDLNNSELDRRTLEKFPRSQHQPLLITASKILTPVPSGPTKR